jgi:hypothetical protein
MIENARSSNARFARLRKWRQNLGLYYPGRRARRLALALGYKYVAPLGLSVSACGGQIEPMFFSAL